LRKIALYRLVLSSDFIHAVEARPRYPHGISKQYLLGARGLAYRIPSGNMNDSGKVHRIRRLLCVYALCYLRDSIEYKQSEFTLFALSATLRFCATLRLSAILHTCSIYKICSVYKICSDMQILPCGNSLPGLAGRLKKNRHRTNVL